MIVILEGMKGSGKSTLAAELSRSLKLPVYRPFRVDPNEHWDGDSTLRAMMERLGVRVNTYVEDLYAADLLAGIGGNVILDRSMPSGYAYGIENGDASVAVLREALNYWFWRLGARTDVAYVHLDVSLRVANKRLGGRQPHVESKWQALEASLTYCYGEAERRFSALRLDASIDDEDSTKLRDAILAFAASKGIR